MTWLRGFGSLIGIAATTRLHCCTGTSITNSNPPQRMLFEKEVASNDWQRSFNEIQYKERNEERFTNLTTKVAESEENLPLNRYYNVLAYDHTRVKVTHGDDDLYVNANLVTFNDANRKYILSQGPLEKTVETFWMMVYQQNTSTIIMLCNCVEMKREKCWLYWPMDSIKPLILKSGLQVIFEKAEDLGHYCIRTFTLKDEVTGETRKIQQYHYVSWPDFNVPDDPNIFLEFLSDVKDSGCFKESCGPPIVHCSAGIGRSGSFILVDVCLVLASKGEELSLKRVINILLDLRTQRMGLIQTDDQLKFSAKAIVKGINNLMLENPDSKTSKVQHVNGKRIASSENEEDLCTSPKKRKNTEF